MSIEIEVLPDPIIYVAKSSYTGPNRHYIVASPRDRLVVYAWVHNHEMALAFHEQNESSGFIASTALELETPIQAETVTYKQIYITTSSHQAEHDTIGWIHPCL